MFRITTLAIISLASVAMASAANIEIGGATGLTNNYITAPNTHGCAGGAGNCINGTVGTGIAEQNYDNVLFSGATSNGGSTTPTPFTGYSTVAATPSGSTMTDSTNGVTFAMISDGMGANASNNVWVLPSNDNGQSLTIPIGVQNVTGVWTMLDALAGLTDVSRDATLAFVFGTTATGGATTTITVKPTNTSATSTLTGQIQDALNCVPLSACSTLAGGPPLVTTTGPNALNGATIPAGVNVITNTLWSTLYTNANGPYSGTVGNVSLSDQGFIFSGAVTSEYLVDIKVSDPSLGASSSLGLSAITVQTSPTPEPSTVLLLLTGLGAIGFARFRRA